MKKMVMGAVVTTVMVLATIWVLNRFGVTRDLVNRAMS